jgi:hypothetical protein
VSDGGDNEMKARRRRPLVPRAKQRVAATCRTERPHQGCTKERGYMDIGGTDALKREGTWILGALVCITSLAGGFGEVVG